MVKISRLVLPGNPRQIVVICILPVKQTLRVILISLVSSGILPRVKQGTLLGILIS
ncbi:hypothetical protein JGI14_102229 [Candidatus Kryptonium thompsonii]|nr:hypothetical protein JGI14_102229 [Candidatus Kryptonium thompsoni]